MERTSCAGDSHLTISQNDPAPFGFAEGAAGLPASRQNHERR